MAKVFLQINPEWCRFPSEMTQAAYAFNAGMKCCFGARPLLNLSVIRYSDTSHSKKQRAIS
jgi:hypothetical protein